MADNAHVAEPAFIKLDLLRGAITREEVKPGASIYVKVCCIDEHSLIPGPEPHLVMDTEANSWEGRKGHEGGGAGRAHTSVPKAPGPAMQF